MSARPTWRREVVRVGVVIVILVAFGMALFVMDDRKSVRSSKVTVFDARLRILCAEMRVGSNTFYLPPEVAYKGFGNSVEAKFRSTLRRLGIRINTLDEVRPGIGPDGRTFLVGYTFPVPPTSSAHLTAELVGDDGARYPLRSKAGGGGGPPERSWNLWVLDSCPTQLTDYALCLMLDTNGIPMAEIRFAEP